MVQVIERLLSGLWGFDGVETGYKNLQLETHTLTSPDAVRAKALIVSVVVCDCIFIFMKV